MRHSMGARDPLDELKTTYFQVERASSSSNPERQLALVPLAQPLWAIVREPGAPARPMILGKPWITVGGERDDISLTDPAAGPGQIVLKPQGDKVFLECSPLSSGVAIGGATVYRAILARGDRFKVGKAELVIADSPDAPVGQELIRAGSTALAKVQPQVMRLYESVKATPRRKRVAGLAIALTLGSLIFTTRLTVSADCELVPQARSWVRSPVAGYVREIRVREGERVRAGDTLAVVSVPDVDRDIARVRHDIDAARALLNQAERGARPTEMLMAQSKERAAHTRALFLERNRQRIARLARQGLESRQALDDATRDAETARAEAELAALAVAHLESGTAPEEVEAKRAELQKLESERDFLEHQRGRAELRSPADGVIATARPAELEGKYVTPGSELLVVLDGQSMVFETKVPEKEIEFVKKGAPVRLRLKGDPQNPVDGVVEDIAPRTEDTVLGRVVPVRCRAESVPTQSLAGLTGTAQISGERVTWASLFIKRVYRWVRTDLL